MRYDLEFTYNAALNCYEHATDPFIFLCMMFVDRALGTQTARRVRLHLADTEIDGWNPARAKCVTERGFPEMRVVVPGMGYPGNRLADGLDKTMLTLIKKSKYWTPLWWQLEKIE